MPILPVATLHYTPLVYTICVITIVYASLSTLRTIDVKELIAYSSVAHAAVYLLGIFSNTIQGIEGGILLGLAHGLVSSGLFISAGGVLYDRTHTRLITFYRGLTQVMPLFTLLFFILALGNSGFPLTFNFVGEFLSLYGAFERMPILGVLASSSIVFSAAFTIWMYNRIAFGGSLSSFFATNLPDLNKREFVILSTLVAFTVLFGVYPLPILDGLHYSVSTLIFSAQTTLPPPLACWMALDNMFHVGFCFFNLIYWPTLTPPKKKKNKIFRPRHVERMKNLIRSSVYPFSLSPPTYVFLFNTFYTFSSINSLLSFSNPYRIGRSRSASFSSSSKYFSKSGDSSKRKDMEFAPKRNYSENKTSLGDPNLSKSKVKIVRYIYSTKTTQEKVRSSSIVEEKKKTHSASLHTTKPLPLAKCSLSLNKSVIESKNLKNSGLSSTPLFSVRKNEAGLEKSLCFSPREKFRNDQNYRPLLLPTTLCHHSTKPLPSRAKSRKEKLSSSQSTTPSSSNFLFKGSKTFFSFSSPIFLWNRKMELQQRNKDSLRYLKAKKDSLHFFLYYRINYIRNFTSLNFLISYLQSILLSIL